MYAHWCRHGIAVPVVPHGGSSPGHPEIRLARELDLPPPVLTETWDLIKDDDDDDDGGGGGGGDDDDDDRLQLAIMAPVNAD